MTKDFFAQERPPNAELRSNQRRKEVLLFLVLLVSYAYFFPRWADWAQNSRFDLVLAIVDQHTLSIDSYYTNTGDYALFDGRRYSDKAPGTALLGVPVYYAFKVTLGNPVVMGTVSRIASNNALGKTLQERGSGLQDSKLYFNAAMAFVTLFTVSIPSAMLGVLLYRFSGHLVSSEAARAMLALVYGLGTSAFPYGQSFASHQIVAFMLFASFYLLVMARKGKVTTPRLILAGFLLGYATISEYPAAIIAGILFVYALYVLKSWARIPWIILGAAGPLLLLFTYDYQVFGTLLPVGYLYSPLYTDLHHTGLISITYPRLDAVWGLTFGSFRGLFFVSPLLLLAIPGYLWFGRRADTRAEFVVCISTTVLFTLFYSASSMWPGGFAVGPRYLVPMLPFLALSTAFALEQMWRIAAGRLLAFALAAWSIAVVWSETIAGQSFPDWTPNPLVNYSLPRLLSGDIARNFGMLLGFQQWYSLAPLVVFFLVASLSLKSWANRGLRSSSHSPVVTLSGER